MVTVRMQLLLDLHDSSEQLHYAAISCSAIPRLLKIEHHEVECLDFHRLSRELGT